MKTVNEIKVFDDVMEVQNHKFDDDEFIIFDHWKDNVLDGFVFEVSQHGRKLSIALCHRLDYAIEIAKAMKAYQTSEINRKSLLVAVDQVWLSEVEATEMKALLDMTEEEWKEEKLREWAEESKAL